MSRERAMRVAEAMRDEISDLIQHEVKDPRVGFVSITRVELSNDLRTARVYVSIMGEPEEQKETLRALEKAKGFFRTELGRRIRLRHVPELTFAHDRSIEHGDRIARLLDKMKGGSE